MSWTIHTGDWIEILRGMPDESVHCCVTSPPYWGLRDYGVPGQLGLERTPEEYVAKMVEGFREVRRVLRKDGTCWLNLGDSYATQTGKGNNVPQTKWKANSYPEQAAHRSERITGLKPKDLVGIPWMVAFALRADGWYLRQDIIWAKKNPMPESVRDRCTKSHECLFLLTKSQLYYFDNRAIAEPLARPEELDRKTPAVFGGRNKWEGAHEHSRLHRGNEYKRKQPSAYKGSSFTDGKTIRPGVGQGERRELTTRNKRSVWNIGTQPYKGAHFATFPPALVEPCIMAGTSEKGCCSQCGKPWHRLTETTRTFESGSVRSGNLPVGKNGAGLQGGGETLDIRRGPVTHSTTVGWDAGCRCDASVVPCTVLDPFGGSGTTGQVAEHLGRNSILIELNPQYVPLMEERLNKPLKKTVSRVPVKTYYEQPVLFRKDS